MVCEDIFTKAKTISNANVEVSFSMCEIYSEIVRDLLAKEMTGAKRASLEVRQDPKSGFYGNFLRFIHSNTSNGKFIFFLKHKD
jgi:hypothetical protein